MSSNNSHDCDRIDCIFKSDPFDQYREVCIKCGKSYSFRKNRFGWFFIIMWIIAGLLMLGNEPESKPEFEQETESYSALISRF